jgi:hypothetical protein
MKNYVLFIIITVSMALSSCGPVPKMSISEPKEIKVGFGPEDMLWDSISSENDRILVSCGSRRDEHSKAQNGIYAINPKTEEVIKLKQQNHPNDLEFHSHGFDLEEIDGQVYLYVINHEDEIGRQSILKYRIQENDLILDSIIQHPFIISPNDIYVLKDGSFFISNDAGKRGSKTEIMLAQKRGSVVYFPAKGSPIVIDDHLGMPNGLYYSAPFLYVSTSMQGKLFRYTQLNNSFTNKTIIAKKLPGGDNLNPYKNGLLVPCHPRYISFIRHAIRAKNNSPSVIYYVSFDGKTKEAVFSNDGNIISCGSTAIIQGNDIYISQIFENFVLKSIL